MSLKRCCIIFDDAHTNNLIENVMRLFYLQRMYSTVKNTINFSDKPTQTVHKNITSTTSSLNAFKDYKIQRNKAQTKIVFFAVNYNYRFVIFFLSFYFHMAGDQHNRYINILVVYLV